MTYPPYGYGTIIASLQSEAARNRSAFITASGIAGFCALAAIAGWVMWWLK